MKNPQRSGGCLGFFVLIGMALISIAIDQSIKYGYGNAVLRCFR